MADSPLVFPFPPLLLMKGGYSLLNRNRLTGRSSHCWRARSAIKASQGEWVYADNAKLRHTEVEHTRRPDSLSGIRRKASFNLGHGTHVEVDPIQIGELNPHPLKLYAHSAR